MQKITGLIVAVGLLLLCQPVFGEDLIGRPNTGDPALDRALEGLDNSLKGGLGDFAKAVGRKYDVPPETVDWLLKKVGMAPSDAYMTVKVARTADKPITTVVREYEANRGRGWGRIAKNLGIKPGSAEFHALKADDAGILEGAAGKGKGKSKGKSKGKGKGRGQKK